MDSWDGCELVERIEGKQDGVPLIKGTRIPADQLVEEYQLGSPIEEIVENYELPDDNVRRIIAFAHKPKSSPVL